MVMAIVKKNNEVKFKIQAQAALALGMLNLGPSKPLCPPHTTSSVGKPCPTTETCWSVVPGLARLCRVEQKVCKYPEVFNLPEKKSEEEIRF